MTRTYGARHWTFTPAPKPANFDALAAAWDDPHRFEIERRAYVEQVEGREGDA